MIVYSITKDRHIYKKCFKINEFFMLYKNEKYELFNYNKIGNLLKLSINVFFNYLDILKYISTI